MESEALVKLSVVVLEGNGEIVIKNSADQLPDNSFQATKNLNVQPQQVSFAKVRTLTSIQRMVC